MLKRLSLVALLVAMAFVPFIAGCASTSPNSLTGSSAVLNDKGRVVGYQAR